MFHGFPPPTRSRARAGARARSFSGRAGNTGLEPRWHLTELKARATGCAHPKLAGKDASQRGNRLAFLRDFGADCREIEELESVSEPPEKLGDLLVVVGHDEVDHIGHGSAEKRIHHLDLELERVARLVRKLHRWGYETVHVVTDHGFLLLDESKLPELVACDKDWCRVRK
ncbi:MAG: PglZ domain-containing protein, partial [bacterium]|nr:PglZ domain-containing protein [bacterium]